MMFAYAKIDNRVKLLGYVVKHFAKVHYDYIFVQTFKTPLVFN